MFKLIRECTQWAKRLKWKVAAIIASALLIGFVTLWLEARLITLLGATPLLALLVSLHSCAIPLLLLQRSSSGKNAARDGSAVPMTETR